MISGTSTEEGKRGDEVSGLDDASLGTPLLRAENKSDACVNFVRFFQPISPCTSQANDLTLKHEMNLMEVGCREGASEEAKRDWQNSRLSQIRHPSGEGALPLDVAQQKRHNELNVMRGIRLGFLLLLTAGAAALGGTLSTNKRSSSSSVVPPVPDNSSQFPSAFPTFGPTELTSGPSFAPTPQPFLISVTPTPSPSPSPSTLPSVNSVTPTPSPSASPSTLPSVNSGSPTRQPTNAQGIKGIYTQQGTYPNCQPNSYPVITIADQLKWEGGQDASQIYTQVLSPRNTNLESPQGGDFSGVFQGTLEEINAFNSEVTAKIAPIPYSCDVDMTARLYFGDSQDNNLVDSLEYSIAVPQSALNLSVFNQRGNDKADGEQQSRYLRVG